MKGIRLVILAVLLALPLQWLSIVAVELYGSAAHGFSYASVEDHGKTLGCSNLHSDSRYACTFGEMLWYSLRIVLLFNLLSFGGFFFVYAVIAGLLILAFRWLWLRLRSARSKVEGSGQR